MKRWIIILLLLTYVNSSTASPVFIDQNTSLVIYTYDTLLADPGYAFDRAFEQYAGLPNGSVKVVYLSDAGEILTRAAAEKDDPVADVLIGLDNVLVSKARAQDVLQPYQPNGYENIIPELIQGLAPDFLLTPYDYGVISLWYLKDRMQNPPAEGDLELFDLTSKELASQLIVENPNLSSPGLGFLLSTIAILGDSEAGVEGVIEGDWVDFWRALAANARLTDSWTDALSLLYEPAENRPMMVSYTTSPAYGNCLYDDPSTQALLTNELGTQWGWQQIEGIGLVKGAKNTEIAKQFIDWFISRELQEQIYLNQWVYPAYKGIPLPDCYSVAIDPATITPLNDRISSQVLDTYLDTWLDKWEVAWVEGSAKDTEPVKGLFQEILPFSPAYLLGFLFLVPVNRRRKE